MSAIPSNPDSNSGPMTLDPPGSIAVVGAGALGIETAIYGRFLGYNVTLIEADSVAASLRDHGDEPLPMLPAECLSPLAVSALQTQSEAAQPITLPVTIGQWIQDALVPLTQSDLLDGQLRMPARVAAITTIAIEPEEDETGAASGDIPPDFRLQFSGDLDPLDAEAVVLAIGSSQSIRLDFDVPAPYLFRVGESPAADVAAGLRQGRRQIVAIFAELAGRADLDLYRPKRS